MGWGKNKENNFERVHRAVVKKRNFQIAKKNQAYNEFF